jgi:hypothetical protein
VVLLGDVEVGADEIVGGAELLFFVPPVAQFGLLSELDEPGELDCETPDWESDFPGPVCPLVPPVWCPPPRAPVSAPVCDATWEKPAAM